LIHLEQTNVIDALDRNYFPVLMQKFDMITGDIAEPQYFESPAFRNTLAFNINEINTMLSLYKEALRQIENLKETQKAS